MSLKDFETKRIVDKGIAHIYNPFIKTMVQRNSFSIGSTLTPTGMAFYIAPYVNAAIRIGSLEEKKLLFESMLDYKAYEMILSTKRGCKGQLESRVEQACRTCSNIKNRQTRERDNLIQVAEQIIEDNVLDQEPILIIQLPTEANCNRNLTGLVANVLMDRYKRPVLLLNQTEKDNEAWWEGSGRGYSKSKLTSFKDFLQDCGIASTSGYAQGHPQAFGFGIPVAHANNFFSTILHKAQNLELSSNYKVDFIYGQQDCSSDDILQIASYKTLWGQGVEEPKLAFEDIIVTKDNITLMSPDKNPTIKITIPNGISFIKFKSSQEEFDSLKPEQGVISLNIIGRCEQNEWGGRVTPQIIIEDYDIAFISKYYF